MPTRKVTRKPKSDKPAKPYKDFPLFPHATKRWAKKIKGKLVYFGPWRDPDGALKLYEFQRDALYAGRRPPQLSDPDAITMCVLCNRFLTVKEHLKGTGEITARTFYDYFVTCRNVLDVFGKDRLVSDVTPEDFEELRRELSKTRGNHALGNEVQRTRVLFKYAYDSALLLEPIRYGQLFKKPSASVMKRERAKRGPRMFEAADIKRILVAASTPMKAMVLLACNCGYGNNDVGVLTTRHLDLKGGWATFPRPKTGAPRRAWLWPETVKAIKAAMAERPTPKGDADTDLVFVTRFGKPWGKGIADSPVTKEFRKLLDKLGLHREGLGFYTLRHVFQTIGDAARDPVVTSFIMGHATQGMSDFYRETIDDARVKAVCSQVRSWLFKGAKAKAK